MTSAVGSESEQRSPILYSHLSLRTVRLNNCATFPSWTGCVKRADVQNLLSIFWIISTTPCSHYLNIFISMSCTQVFVLKHIINEFKKVLMWEHEHIFFIYSCYIETEKRANTQAHFDFQGGSLQLFRDLHTDTHPGLSSLKTMAAPVLSTAPSLCLRSASPHCCPASVSMSGCVCVCYNRREGLGIV